MSLICKHALAVVLEGRAAFHPAKDLDTPYWSDAAHVLLESPIHAQFTLIIERDSGAQAAEPFTVQPELRFRDPARIWISRQYEPRSATAATGAPDERLPTALATTAARNTKSERFEEIVKRTRTLQSYAKNRPKALDKMEAMLRELEKAYMQEELLGAAAQAATHNKKADAAKAGNAARGAGSSDKRKSTAPQGGRAAAKALLLDGGEARATAGAVAAGPVADENKDPTGAEAVANADDAVVMGALPGLPQGDKRTRRLPSMRRDYVKMSNGN